MLWPGEKRYANYPKFNPEFNKPLKYLLIGGKMADNTIIMPCLASSNVTKPPSGPFLDMNTLAI